MMLQAESYVSCSKMSWRDIDAALKTLFPFILRDVRVGRGMTQSELVELAQMNRHLFANLDTVTLSRWERGFTIPALYKQAEILSVMGGDLFFSLVDAIKANDALKNNSSGTTECANINRFPVLPYGSQEAINLNCCKIEEAGKGYFSDIVNYIKYHEPGNCDNLDSLFRSKATKIYIATGMSGALLGHLIEVCAHSSDICAYAKGVISMTELLERSNQFVKNDKLHRLLFSSYCGSNEVFKLVVGSMLLKFLSNTSPTARLTSRTGNEALIKTLKRMGVQPQCGGSGDYQCFSISRKEAVATRQILVLAIYAAINNPGVMALS